MIKKPIYLHKNAVVTINVYTRPDDIEDVWITDFPQFDEDYENVYKEAAEQFIDQLKDEWTVGFLEALRKEIDKRLEPDELYPGTSRYVSICPFCGRKYISADTYYTGYCECGGKFAPYSKIE